MASKGRRLRKTVTLEDTDNDHSEPIVLDSSSSSSSEDDSFHSDWMEDFEDSVSGDSKPHASKKRAAQNPPAQSPLPDNLSRKKAEANKKSISQTGMPHVAEAQEARSVLHTSKAKAPESKQHPAKDRRGEGRRDERSESRPMRPQEVRIQRVSKRRRKRSKEKKKRAPTFLPHYGLVGGEPAQASSDDSDTSMSTGLHNVGGVDDLDNHDLEEGEIVPLPDDVPAPRFSEKWHDVAAFARPSHLANKANAKALSSIYESQKFEKRVEGSLAPKRKTNIQNRKKMKKQVPSLQILCARTVANFIDCVESFGCVPPDVKKLIATELARQRRLNSESLGLFLSDELTNLQLLCCSDLDEASLSSISTCQSLMRLELSQCGFMTDHVFSMISDGCPLITEISLHGAYLVSDRSMIPFLRSRPNLRSLKMEWMNLITMGTLVALLESCPSVEYLFINECPEVLSDESMGVVGRIKSLIDLHIEAALMVSDDGAKMLFATPNTTLLHFSFIKNNKITTAGLKKMLENLPGIIHLCLEKMTCVDDNIVGLIANNCLNIRKLNINRCEAVKDESIRNLVSIATLEELKISGTNITGDIVLDICKYGTEMRELDFSWCRALHDEHMVYISKNCKRVQKVTLWGCTPITSTGVMALLESGIQVEGKEQFYTSEE